MGGSGSNISGDAQKVIIDQMKKSICQIKNGTGFLCIIPFPDRCNLKPVLITSNRVLTENDIEIGKKLKIILNNGEKSTEINIDDNRFTYTSSKYEITMIEIKSKELDINNFLEIDEKTKEDDPFKEYKEKHIYLMYYSNDGEYKYNSGEIRSIGKDKKDIDFKSKNKDEALGGPIMNLVNYKVIGVYRRKNEGDYKIGTFIIEPILDFYNTIDQSFRTHSKLMNQT